jgi:predicted Na+-dependent transporter
VRLGRRPLFFLVVAVVCAVLVPATPSEFRWVNLSMAGLALFWCVMLAGEDLARRRRRPPPEPGGRP